MLSSAKAKRQCLPLLTKATDDFKINFTYSESLKLIAQITLLHLKSLSIFVPIISADVEMFSLLINRFNLNMMSNTDHPNNKIASNRYHFCSYPGARKCSPHFYVVLNFNS